MVLFCPLRIVHKKKLFFILYTKSFIKPGYPGYWLHFFCMWMDLDSILIYKLAKKKKTCRIFSHLDLFVGQYRKLMLPVLTGKEDDTSLLIATSHCFVTIQTDNHHRTMTFKQAFWQGAEKKENCAGFGRQIMR